LEINISGWARNHGDTQLLSADLDSGISKLQTNERYTGGEVKISEPDPRRVRLIFGPTELNMHGNYIVSLDIFKSEILSLAIKALEETPFGEIINGTKRSYLEAQWAAYNLSKTKSELRDEKQAHQMTKLRCHLPKPGRENLQNPESSESP
jgi:hypothetical protein